MNQSKKKVTRTVIIMVVFAAVVLTVFYFVSNNTDTTEKEDTIKTANTEVEKLIMKDLTTGYPATPKEVMKLYSRFSKVFYDCQYSEEQFVQLVEQYRLLLDDKLLEQNPLDQYVNDLKNEVADYKEHNRTISSYIIGNSSSVTYNTVNKEKYARMNVAYSVKEGTVYSKVYETFVFHKNDKAQWKIVGWDITDPTTIDSEE